MPKGKQVVVFEDGVDDFDGKPVAADEAVTIYLAVDDQAWNLYLRPENATKLTETLAKYTADAEPAKSKAAGATGLSMAPEERKALMEWSRNTDGIPAVADRGRVKASTLSAWEKAGKPGFSKEDDSKSE